MNQKLKEIGVAMFYLGMALCIFGAGRLVGISRGYSQALDDQKQWNCKSEYGNTPQNEISGDCLKYFIVK